MDHTTEVQLVEAARTGDDVAFAQLFRRWFEPLHDLCVRVTGSADAGADLAEEVYFRAVDAFPAIPVGGTFRALIFTIAWRLLDREAYFAGEAAVPGGLTPRQQAIYDLDARYGLEGSDVARVLGVSAASGDVLSRRLRAVAGDTAGASAPVLLVPPSGLEDSVLRDVLLRWPPDGIVPSRPARTPEAAAGQPPGPWRTFLVAGVPLLAIAGIFALLLLAPFSPVALTRENDADIVDAVTAPLSGTARSASAAPTASRTPSPTVTGTALPSPTVPGTAPSPTAGVATATAPLTGITPTPTVRPATPTPAPPTPTPQPTATPTPSATPTPCFATLSSPVAGSGVSILPGTTSFFDVFNSFCAAVSFDVVVVSGGEWFEVSRDVFAIEPGRTARITVSAAPPVAPGTYTGRIRISGPNNTIEVEVRSERR